MARSNRQRIDETLEHLREGLIPFVEAELKSTYGEDWKDNVNSGLRNELSSRDTGLEWDTYAILKVMFDHWRSVFGQRLGRNERSYVSELQTARNDYAHDKKFSYDDAERGIDTARRLLVAAGDAKRADKLAALRKETIRIQQDEEARNQVRSARALEGTPTAGLKSWREAVTPHSDVATGRYTEAEFAADLAKVHNGQASEEYLDAGKFFSRTFMTDGLRELLEIGVRRLTGNGGDPVVQLQTNFGGGKTHSMLALYHLFGGGNPSDFAGIEDILRKEQITDQLPKANRAVVVGTDLPPGQTRTKDDGTIVHTMWGEIAHQLGGAEGYALLEDSDKKGTNPGSGVLEELFRTYSPCIIFIDEWVAYLRQLPGRDDLPGGTEDSNFSFAQALSEAVKTVDDALLVASLPVSDIEIGGDHGSRALSRLENVFKRVAKPWEPASSNEGFEIVRRRLFQSDMDHAARDNVIKAFMELYKKDSSFPNSASEEEYRKRLTACYPIHPELFERLDQDWCQLERFQRTRGVLRLMSSVIHELWTSESNGLLIMPSMVPLESGRVTSLITECLPDGRQWSPVIHKDVAGGESLPLSIDADNPNFNKVSAARRVARAVFFGSAPTINSNNRGLDDPRIKLACVQPGENVNAFGDALRRLTDRATHLYLDNGRYWYSLQPTVTRVASDLRIQFLREASENAKSDVHAEVERRLRKENERGKFSAIHIAPADAGDVSDETRTRLVVLGPNYEVSRGASDSSAHAFAKSILESKGNSPRIHRNTLVFLAPDKKALEKLYEDTASYLAWQQIEAEKEERNLNAHAMKQSLNKRDEFDRAADIKLRETWQWVLVPDQPVATDGKIHWELCSATGQDSLGKKVSKKLENDELLISIYGPRLLLMELDKHLWQNRDHIEISQLAEAFANYLYLPRLTSPDVLKQAITSSFDSGLILEFFAYATDFDEASGKYLGLQTNTLNSLINLNEGLLVKEDVAREHQAENEKEQTEPSDETGSTGDTSSKPTTGGNDDKDEAQPNAPSALPKHFFGEFTIDAAKPGATLKVSDYFREVITHLSNDPDNKVKVRLVVEAESTNGFDTVDQRNVTENNRTITGEPGCFE